MTAPALIVADVLHKVPYCLATVRQRE